ncbi:MAG: ATP-binding cassette domain-containing protein [Planctomycetes bacterium]|nr:ATP-binding cassette domain-containing protein [Planctomycetota bacterium]
MSAPAAGTAATTARGAPAPGEPLVRALAVTTVYDRREVLRGVDLEIRRGEVFVILGPSGCGKTTLLRHLCGLMPPTAGTVRFRGRDVYAMSEEDVRAMRLATGLSFQGGALLGSLSLLENVALPLRENTGLAEGVILEIARMKLDMVGLLHAAHLPPSSISGGMRKRAAIARAIAMDPEIVYFDEPSAGLDPITAAEVDNLILKLNHVFGITMVVVTHDLASAHAIAHRCVLLLGGEVAALGGKDTIWGSADPRIRNFLERRMAEAGAGRLDLAPFLVV